MRVISGKKRGLKLTSIENTNVRPTLDRVKENIFNIISKEIVGSVFMDIFGGFGGIGIEAYSRGAKKVYIFEIENKNFKIITKNVSKLDAKNNIEVFNEDYKYGIKKISNENIKADIIYIDPPYYYEIYEYLNILENIKNSNILKEKSKIIIECEKQIQNQILENYENIKDFEIIDKRNYGRAAIVFLQKEGK